MHGNWNIRPKQVSLHLCSAPRFSAHYQQTNGTCNTVTVALLTRGKTQFGNKIQSPCKRQCHTPHAPAPCYNVVQSVKWRQTSRCYCLIDYRERWNCGLVSLTEAVHFLCVIPPLFVQDTVHRTYLSTTLFPAILAPGTFQRSTQANLPISGQ
jgi:hypothetical protein